MIYDKEHTGQISFPLGGIGSGSIGLKGNGRLCDWEIYNAANKNSLNGLTHFAVRTEGSGTVGYRILQGDAFEPYSGTYRKGDDGGYSGFGWGPSVNELAGLPHFRRHEFRGTFPTAEVIFSGEEASFPVSAKLTAWSPFIPGMDRESSLPCAVLEYTFVNLTGAPLETTAVGVLGNPWRKDGSFNRLRGKRLTVSSGGDPESVDFGEITLSAEADEQDISGQEYLYIGGWNDCIEMYLNDLKRGGRFRPRTCPEPHGGCTGLLAVHFTLKPGEAHTVRFVLTWHVPNRKNTWGGIPDSGKEEADAINPVWKNYYATQWADSTASAEELEARMDELRAGTFRFRDDIENGTLHEAVRDGASAALSTLRTPTCLRLQDGTLWGWEGLGTGWGSCPGSCIHVWNYVQAVAFLFPALSRGMIESHLKYSVDEFGGAHFRLALPLGIHAKPDWFRPCADGQFGLIMQCYRDWKLGAGTDWIRSVYPTLKRMMEFTWSEKNADRWDPDESGMLTGRTHHTLDMELFAPNSWLEGIYLGALLAMTKIAQAAGDDDFSGKCAAIFEKGRKKAKALFNGRYFQQNIDLSDKTLIDRWEDAAASYWNAESKEIKYQIGEGCGIDAVLGECHAHLYGLGHVFEPEMTVSTLKTIYECNFVRNFREHENVWRIYGLNDESGVLICSWPDGAKRPAIPIPYNTETMHGFEWAFATHLMLTGFTAEAEEIAKSIRDRYDGRKRNPWNEIECGSNYARSMASFGLIPAQSGFRFDMDRGFLGFAPKTAANGIFRSLWSIGTAWGLYRQSGRKIELTVDGGSLTLRGIAIPDVPVRIELNDKAVLFTREDGEIRFSEPLEVSGTLKFLLES